MITNESRRQFLKGSGGLVLGAYLPATLAQSGPGYLTLIGWYDGQGVAACLRGRTLAVTAAGSRAVWICPQFALEQRRDPGLAEATLVHEALHSLGLGENPVLVPGADDAGLFALDDHVLVAQDHRLFA